MELQPPGLGQPDVKGCQALASRRANTCVSVNLIVVGLLIIEHPNSYPTPRRKAHHLPISERIRQCCDVCSCCYSCYPTFSHVLPFSRSLPACCPLFLSCFALHITSLVFAGISFEKIALFRTRKRLTANSPMIIWAWVKKKHANTRCVLASSKETINCCVRLAGACWW